MPKDLAPRPIWIGLVDATPITAGDPTWTEHFPHSTGGIATGVAFAVDAAEFRSQIAEALARLGAAAARFEDVETLEARRAREPDGNPQEELVGELRLTGLPQLGVFHLYGPEEFESESDWLAAVAERDDLTELQRDVLRQLARMLRGLDLPLLDHIDLETPKGSTVVHLSHQADGGIDLEVRVAPDDDVVVDYGLGHVHFAGGRGSGGAGEVFDFIYSALQGGVMVEVWTVGGTVTRVRTLILAEGGGWDTVSTTALTSSVAFDDEPTDRRLLGFTSTEGVSGGR
jgi:hypothetical protein